MPLSSTWKRKQQLRVPRLYKQRSEKDIRILKSHCDLCNDELPKEADNIQYRINVLDEIDDSFESEYDKHETSIITLSKLQQGVHDSQLLLNCNFNKIY